MLFQNKVCGSILLSSNNRVLLVKGKKTGKWSFPKGHINPGETKFECAARETFEETGILLGPLFNQIHILITGIYFQYYTIEKECFIYDTKEVSDVAWIPLDNLINYSINIDVKTFLKRRNTTLLKEKLNKPVFPKCINLEKY